MLADYHVHSAFSDDSTYPMEQVVRDAIRINLDELCFTEHVDYGVKPDWDHPEGARFENGRPLTMLSNMRAGSTTCISTQRSSPSSTSTLTLPCPSMRATCSMLSFRIAILPCPLSPVVVESNRVEHLQAGIERLGVDTRLGDDRTCRCRRK